MNGTPRLILISIREIQRLRSVEILLKQLHELWVQQKTYKMQ